MSTKQALNDDKLHGSVAAYLRCGGVVNTGNQIKKGLLLSLRVKKKFKIGDYLAKLQANVRDCLVHFLHLLEVC